ncbi:hypothetical protein [Streptomyces sp. ISL-100]|uniref:hypothetical protein n=1 Tax=Streptomyces sp. ISL-100 TaxID=2819173 RepID=UPI0035AB6A16
MAHAPCAAALWAQSEKSRGRPAEYLPYIVGEPGQAAGTYLLVRADQHPHPFFGHALRALFVRVRWTVEALAAKTGVSRAALARRFTALVGSPR